MPRELMHEMKIGHRSDRLARQDFVSGLRAYILNDMASAMREGFEQRVAPAFEAQHGRAPETQDEVHDAMKADVYFKYYSAVRYNAQEMVWRSVIPSVAEALPALKQTAADLDARTPGLGSLQLDPALTTPSNVSAVDVHLMPGGYALGDEIATGAIYDNGVAVFSAGFMGPDLDDIGQSFAHWLKYRHPEFEPQAILDCGCSIGHNTTPWAMTFPDAQVHAIDVGAAGLRYGHARAQSMGLGIHFRQMDATRLDYPDASFDVVFSSMFLHELPLPAIRAYLAEALRVLRPGGMLITMELPPNQALKPYDQFYLDWDCYYNKEPFYRRYRDQDPQRLMQSAGFAAADCFEFTMPQFSFTPLDQFIAAVQSKKQIDGDTGRLSASLQWFGFGARKPLAAH